MTYLLVHDIGILVHTPYIGHRFCHMYVKNSGIIFKILPAGRPRGGGLLSKSGHARVGGMGLNGKSNTATKTRQNTKD